jgi:hypothetical protein
LNILLNHSIIILIQTKENDKLFTARTEENQKHIEQTERRNILTIIEKTSLSTFQFMKIMKKETKTKKKRCHTSIHHIIEHGVA